MGDYSSRYHLFTRAFVRVNKNKKLPSLANSLQTPETPNYYIHSVAYFLSLGRREEKDSLGRMSVNQVFMKIDSVR